MAAGFPHSVDIAGTAWPVYKLEAVAVGLILCLVLGMITASAQFGVLAGASLAAIRWALGAMAAHRTHSARAGERALSAH
ncbi:hypothetical protein [Nocardia arizonensis]|uniref:hypothetical protein n=1 Tax=Nocardia arizonensis TaxID=1141647 RepID=UPI0006D2096D|nr:hypothetical protein [Nocardia arizonensis]